MISIKNSKSSSRVIARVFGGLGNQLFCYSAARRLALMNDLELVIDDVSGFSRDFRYKRFCQLGNFNISSRSATAAERFEPFSRIRRYMIRRLNKLKSFEKRNYIIQEGVDFDCRLIDLKVKGSLYLEGYWQSESYFKDIEDVLRNDLTITPPLDQENQSMSSRINQCNSVAIHVRFFDHPNFKGVNNVANTYYSNAIEIMEKLNPNAHYFVFSDIPEYVKDLISLSDERMTIVQHNHEEVNAYADLWLMSQCSNFIIANSTFSWWGAWLGKSENKIVLAPDFKISSPGKITSWGFEGLIPDSWKTVCVGSCDV